ncbi:MAG: hypothetical protein ACKN89_15720 [Cyanobium sp.]
MQFNLVVDTRPGAFQHQRLGYVDALVMVQALVKVRGHEGGLGQGPLLEPAAQPVQ